MTGDFVEVVFFVSDDFAVLFAPASFTSAGVAAAVAFETLAVSVLTDLSGVTFSAFALVDDPEVVSPADTAEDLAVVLASDAIWLVPEWPGSSESALPLPHVLGL